LPHKQFGHLWSRDVETIPEPIETRVSPLPQVDTIFEQLRHDWEAGTRFDSSVTAMVRHPSYLEIIGLGPIALPLILRALDEKPQHWFWALRSITRTDPAADQQTVEGARDAWLRWGRDHLLL